MHRDELADDVARELGDRNAVLGGDGIEVVGIGLAGRGLFDIDEGRDPGWDLHALVTEARSPRADVVKGIEGWLVARELGKENRRAFDRLHGWNSPIGRLG